MAEHHGTIDDYIASQPAEMQAILTEVRKRFHEAVPGAGEKISYGIPTITLDGHYVVYFAGWKHHLSVYPVPHGDDELRAEMAPFLTGKGTLKFPLGKPIPYDMIEKVAARLAAEREGRK